MIIIAHRGLLDGPNKQLENHPEQIQKAINKNFNVELDVRVIDNCVFLGHDTPDYEVDEKWLIGIAPFLWIHCKNIEAITYFKHRQYNFHYFWHEEDTLTLTSRGYVWVYPGKQPVANSIAVLPEIHNDTLKGCVGVCTDYPIKYSKECNND